MQNSAMCINFLSDLGTDQNSRNTATKSKRGRLPSQKGLDTLQQPLPKRVNSTIKESVNHNAATESN